MKYIDRIRLSLTGVGSNKFRAFLTLLGIIIGVSAVIIMVSLGSGTQAVVGGQFDGLLTSQTIVDTNWNLPYRQRGQLVLEDKTLLEESILGVEKVVPFFEAWLNLRLENSDYQRQVIGVNENALEVTSLELMHGRGIDQLDISNQERVAVIGRRTLENLSDNQDFSSFLGEEISIDGNNFLIIGILDLATSSVGYMDNIVMVPYTSFRNIWRHQGENVNRFFITFDNQSTERDIIAQTEFLLNHKYGTTASGESRFLIHSLQGQVDIMNNIVQVFTLVLGGIAAISLMVGGIGVMNIMLVTVKERTKEIGVRKAIGASTADIQKQFLLESIILTLLGGLVGIIIGVSFSFLVNFGLSYAFEWWQGAIPAWVVLLSFGVTVFIGIVFGFYPAYKASKLDPIDALRYG